MFLLFWRIVFSDIGKSGTSGADDGTCTCKPIVVYRDRPATAASPPPAGGDDDSPQKKETDNDNNADGRQGGVVGDEIDRAAIHRRGTPSEVEDTCADGYYLSHLLSRYIDIDFIEFVLSSQPSPPTAPIVDIGIYQAGELIHMARSGFHIHAFEPNPHRYNACMTEIRSYPTDVQNRIRLRNLAVSDSGEPLHFQLAGLDSHLYLVDESKGEKAKEKSITVPTIPIAEVVTNDTYFVKIDTQGFDTKIMESLLSALEKSNVVVPFIQFEFSPHFEVTRARRSKEEHKKFFRRLIDAGYDVFQGAATQPWIRSHRSTYGKSPLAMLAVDRDMPTCVDAFVDRMHEGRTKPLFPGKTSTDYGTWMDILAVRRVRRSPYYRHTGWVLSRRM
ncbi:methyltransferase family 21, putative [Bodo saltans]|uniref:Methyltransferase family 21, putative n=1 Tax=Bodo saltans TaxID=75058 RepID=A0A0S4J0L3_BODSA|nr:methyltransferase family 21, putative [Bodo saltans]|eukprot:CUG35848.1 methyltransferase family 21, putative [Bodo saltans]